MFFILFLVIISDASDGISCVLKTARTGYLIFRNEILKLVKVTLLFTNSTFIEAQSETQMDATEPLESDLLSLQFYEIIIESIKSAGVCYWILQTDVIGGEEFCNTHHIIRAWMKIVEQFSVMFLEGPSWNIHEDSRF